MFLALLPFLTTVLGYWFGNKGASDARGDASDAKTDAKKANHGRQLALAALSPEVAARLLADHPESFS
jgi:hypothetical protein